MNRIFTIVIILIWVSCKSEPRKLWWTEASTEHENDFLFLAESSNIKWLSKDSLATYLSDAEIKEVESITNETIVSETWKKGVGYENHGEIFKTDKYRLIVLLKTDNTTEYRNYAFILRTYDQGNDIVDDMTIAKWNEIDDIFCYGSVDENLQIVTDCEKAKKYLITKEGMFKIKN